MVEQRHTIKPWFGAKKRGLAKPISWQGWLVCFSYILFFVGDFFRIDSTSHSVSDTLRPFIIQVFITTVILLIIVSVTAENRHKKG